MLKTSKKLYPLKFIPIYMERIWGGNKLFKKLGRKDIKDPTLQIGESWEISEQKEAISVVANGEFQGKTIRELLDLFGHSLIGTKLDPKKPFPLLVKILDAKEVLSIQLHPDLKDIKALQKLAIAQQPIDLFSNNLKSNSLKSRNFQSTEEQPKDYKFKNLLTTKSLPTNFQHAKGKLYNSHPNNPQPKNEMWYILDNEPESYILAGLNSQTSKEEFIKNIQNQNIEKYLNKFPTSKDSAFFIKAGTVHAIGGGNLMLEIQQNSDTTYRIYDYNRKDNKGNLRDLHIRESKICIENNPVVELKTKQTVLNTPQTLINNNPYFKSTIYTIKQPLQYKTSKQYCEILNVISADLEITIKCENLMENLILKRGETALLPAGLEFLIRNIPSVETNLLLTTPLSNLAI